MTLHSLRQVDDEKLMLEAFHALSRVVENAHLSGSFHDWRESMRVLGALRARLGLDKHTKEPEEQ